MNSDPAALIACESVLDPTLERLTTVLDEHSANFADPVAEALERLRSAAAEASLIISAAILETLGPIPPERRWALAGRTDPVMWGIERRSPMGRRPRPGMCGIQARHVAERYAAQRHRPPPPARIRTDRWLRNRLRCQGRAASPRLPTRP